MKICANCANLVRLEPPNSPRYNIWYNLICAATPLVESIDPVVGVVGYKKTNDLGMEYYSDKPYEYCREVNKDGDCPKFYPRGD